MHGLAAGETPEQFGASMAAATANSARDEVTKLWAAIKELRAYVEMPEPEPEPEPNFAYTELMIGEMLRLFQGAKE